MTTPSPASGLETLISADQLAAVRRGLWIAIPVNVLLSAATFAVSTYHDRAAAGALWFVASTAVSLARFSQCLSSSNHKDQSLAEIDRDLRWASYLALLSGLVWATTPLLPSENIGPDAVFHLIVAAGITGGSIAMGFAHAPVAICFVTPILLANALALLATHSTANTYLAITVMIYLAALLRSARQGEITFRATTKLKHEATNLAASLSDAHAQTIAVAEEMTYRAQHDSLTGLLNRAGFMAELESRSGQTPHVYCLMLLDLDGFKSINDTFGHKVGDHALIEVAQRICTQLPSDAAAARLGGDEFAVVFESGEMNTAPEEIADRLSAAIDAPFASFDAGRLGVSIGIYVGGWSSGDDILVYADEALYAAKSAGRNRRCLFDEALKRRLEMRRDSERDLVSALQNGTLRVWYQPIFSAGGGRLSGIEALLRWNHPKHGPISPTEIIPVAALAGLSERLFGFVADEAIGMALALRSLRCGNLTVAINVSPSEIARLPIDRLLLDRVQRAGLPATALEIEITEETALDIRSVQGKLSALSRAGVRIAIDDFGVGYSSLASLRQLHADRIKIDRSFVTGLATSADNRMLVQAMIGLGRAMNFDVVAEGVETADDLLVLRTLGCQFMQGYHLGRPMPAAALLDLVAGRAATTAA